MGFVLVIGFVEHLQIVTTSNYSAIANSCTLRGVLDSSWTVIVVTASVGKMRRKAKDTLPQAYCVSLPRDTAL
jgi:hypothetical protein